MKLDAKLVRYLDNDHYRVLTATEMGSRNHEVVPVELIMNLSQIRNGSMHLINDLARHKLIAKVINTKYDGYRLTYGGYDYLALKTLSRRDVVFSVGNQIGVGKESDIYIVADADGNQHVLKLHRLGRTSFRNIKNTRDYLRHRHTTSWLYLARLAARKEYIFMETLYNHGFPVPKPIDVNRHCVVMELVDAIPLSQVSEVGDPGKLYSDLMNLVVKLAKSGLIHGDFNEFNLLITPDQKPIVIDFPQMVSTRHANAKMYFDRDVNCIRIFFAKRFGYESTLYPIFSKIMDQEQGERLDVAAAASGFTLQQQLELERGMEDLEQEEPESEEESDKNDEQGQEDNDQQDEVNEVVDQLQQTRLTESHSEEVVSDAESIEHPHNESFRAHRDDSSKKTPSALAQQTTRVTQKYKKLTAQDIKERVAQNLKTASHKNKPTASSRRNRVKKGAGRAAKDNVKYGSIGWDD